MNELHRNLNPLHDRLMRYFAYAHLPTALQEISQPFAELAERMAVWFEHEGGMDAVEMTVALRKLLEAKDCAVRSLKAKP